RTSDHMCFYNLRTAPFAGTPIEDLSLLNKCVHSAHYFFNRGVFIRTMAEIQIEVVELKSFKRFMTGFYNMLATETCLIGFVVGTTPAEKHFAGYDIRGTFPVFLLQNSSH